MARGGKATNTDVFVFVVSFCNMNQKKHSPFKSKCFSAKPSEPELNFFLNKNKIGGGGYEFKLNIKTEWESAKGRTTTRGMEASDRHRASNEERLRDAQAVGGWRMCRPQTTDSSESDKQ